MSNDAKNDAGYGCMGQRAVTRRGFITAACGAGAGAAAIGMLSGCASNGPASDEKNRDDTARKEFEAAADPIDPVEPPDSWDYEYDVVVVGSGGGGITGSVRLVDEGLKVALLEKNEKTGGTTAYGGMFVNAGGHRQANEAQWALPSYPYDPSKVVAWVNDQQQMTVDSDLLYAMAVEGPKCIDWMEDNLQVPWAPASAGPSGFKSLYWEGQITKTNSIEINYYPMEMLTERALEHGVEVFTNTQVETLVVENGRVVGVRTRQGEETKFFKASRAVLLTAGGFEMNRAMLEKYTPNCLRGIVNVATPPYNRGECIRMGLGVGADLSGYESVACFDGSVEWEPYDEYAVEMTAHVNKDGNQALRQPWLLINRMGSRVPYLSTAGTSYPYETLSEDSLVTALTDQAAVEMSQPGGRTYVCFDSKYEQLVMDNYFKQSVCRVGKVVAEDDGLIDRVPEWQRDWRDGFQMMLESGAVKKCDTVEELESALGLREGILVQAVAKWNDACENGEDWVSVYKYDPSWLIPINEPPYYGAKIGGNIFATKCGLRVNPNMQVIDGQGAVIPGLYAGWHTAGGSNGENNIAGKPFNGLYGDVGLSFIGGYMAAGGILAE